MLYSFTSIKNAFLRQCWQLTCLSIFHIMPNASRGVKYVTISNFSTRRFLIQGFILKKIDFSRLLLPKCFKNKLKNFEKCLKKVEKIRKFFFFEIDSNASQMVEIHSQAPLGPQRWFFDTPTCPERLSDLRDKLATNIALKTCFLCL